MTRLLCAMLLAGASVSGWCQSATGAVATGKVHGVYIKLAEGVFLESRRAPRTLSSSEVWADMRFAGNAPHGRRFALARITDLKDVEVGDLVEVEFVAEEVRIARGSLGRIAPVTQSPRVTMVAAKYFTPAAQLFGGPLHAEELDSPRMPRPVAVADTF